MKTLMAMASLLLLAACAGQYDESLSRHPTARFEAPPTTADIAARRSYDSSSFFSGRPN